MDEWMESSKSMTASTATQAVHYRQQLVEHPLRANTEDSAASAAIHFADPGE